MMKRMGIFSAVVMAAWALWAAAPSVTITKAQQRYPWNDKIDIDWSLTCDTAHLYRLSFLFIDGATTNTVETDVTVQPSDNITAKSGRTTVDVPVQAVSFDEKLRTGGIQIVALLTAERVLPPDPNKLDEGDGTTFVPGDYLILGLQDGSITIQKNVQVASAFQDAQYKTTKMVFRRVPVGSFMMQAKDAVNHANTSGTKVTFTNDYYIAIYPCTVAQYNTMVGGTASSETKPKTSVSWDMIAGTTSPQLLTTYNAGIAASGYELALPNEAQWERAARAGTTTEWFFGASDATLADYAWYSANFNYNSDLFCPVGGLDPNAWGLYDMYGNAYEWCFDWWAATIDFSEQPGGPASGTERILRGGYYKSESTDCSSVSRQRTTPSSKYGMLFPGYGFRLVLIQK